MSENFSIGSNPNVKPLLAQASVDTTEVKGTQDTVFSSQEPPKGTENSQDNKIEDIKKNVSKAANEQIKSSKTADLLTLLNDVKSLSEDVKNTLKGDISKIEKEIAKRKEDNKIIATAANDLAKAKPTAEAYGEIAKVLELMNLADDEAEKVTKLKQSNAIGEFGKAVDFCEAVKSNKLIKELIDDIKKSPNVMQYVERDAEAMKALYASPNKID